MTLTLQCGKCQRPIKATEAMKKRFDENPNTTFYCSKCRKLMIDERIAGKMPHWVRKGGSQ